MHSMPTIVLPSDPNQSKQPEANPSGCEAGDKPPKKHNALAEKISSLPKPGEASGAGATFGGITLSPEMSLEETIQRYLEKVATPEHSEASLLTKLEELNSKGLNRIPINHDNTEATATESQAFTSSIKSNDVWIPPLLPSVPDLAKDSHTDKYPFLQTESLTRCHNDHDLSLNSKTSTSQLTNDNKKDYKNNHWIKVTTEECFDELVQYLHTPRDDLRQLLLFRNRGFEGASPCLKSTTRNVSSSATLQLRPGVSKDDRRKVHHILAKKNKHFESSIRNQRPKQGKCSKSISKQKEEKNRHAPAETTEVDTTDLVVTWRKHALKKGAKKNNKRKRFENDGGNSSNRNTVNSLLCVLKKTNKEHLTAIQILTKMLRCRQSDIGFAGIKDMQAITYQFITLRNMTQQRAERTIHRQLGPGNRDVQLKILSSNVDFVLNIGCLEGNQFEIVVRNLRRVKLDQVQSNSNADCILEPAKECFVDCDNAHIDRMVERIKQQGFINFYGEQRIGAPGNSKDVGVRAFEIGRAMLRQDFKGAIKLLMEGTRHHETDRVRRVRQAWKNSNGDPSITLKAFQKADIMPRERAVLRGLNRYPDNPLEALRFLNYNMRIFYINAYQSYIFNQVASRRIKLFGDKVIKGDLYFDKDEDDRDNVKVVEGTEVPSIEISQVVLPLPGYNVRYPEHEIGQLYRDLLEADNIGFEKESVPEATAKGNYRKFIVHPGNLMANIDSSDSSSKSMKLSFELPKGCYATMLLRELMLTTVARSK
eukprot:CAMPEP_0168193906 /NCGR_PEP_ID=MMETSP0139_2-20121125/18875_1 /TAXON_ID=44445 /ORGANISM="Pseudo-nitzschia australis, Strain 10249 10 AB" /LENGTH=763 /DNA_ID=CAMNT_0008117331 /DNA_START=99 /DNA_END=2387 /DNA_ORIENTATION=+